MKARDYDRLVGVARARHNRYPIRGRNVLRFLLESFTLTLEVFFQSRMGLYYFSIPKAFLGLIFPFLCMLLVNFGVELHISILPWNLGFIRAFPTISLPDSWEQFGQDFHTAYSAFNAILQHSDWRESQDISQFAILTYIIAANLRWVEQMWNERTDQGPHPRSSGDPYRLFNPVYYYGEKFHLEIDIVKQFAQPLTCIVLAFCFEAVFVGNNASASADAQKIKFIPVWLGLGAMAMMLRAFLENRDRSKAAFEARAAEFDSEAISAGEEDEEPDAITETRQPFR